MVLVKILGSMFLLALLASRSRPPRAAWWVWPTCLLIMPEWMDSYLLGTPLKVDFVLLGSLLVLWHLWQGRDPRYRLTLWWLDLVVLLMLVSDLISQATNMGFRPTTLTGTLPRYLPYLIGRFYLRTTEDIPEAARAMTRIIAITAVLAAIETLVQVRVMGTILDTRAQILVRNGLGRAQVGLQHPILLGVSLVLLLPWTLDARAWACAGLAPRWLRFGPLWAALGMLSSLSRGPWITGIAAALIDRFFRRPRQRVPIAAFLLVSTIVVNYYQEPLINFISELVGERSAKSEAQQIVVLNGEPYVYTGTRHRILLYVAYADAMAHAGLFGYDQKWVNWIPQQAPVFWSIDNHYIALKLVRGYLGYGLFVLAILLSLYRLLRTALPFNRPQSGLAGALFGSLLCTGLALHTVAFSTASQAIFMFTIGVAVSLYRLPTIEVEYPGGDEAFSDEIYEPDDIEGNP